MKSAVNYLYTAIIFLILLAPVNGQEKKHVTIIPGEQFKAGWLKELFFGEHWRDVWGVPIEVEVLDLNKFAGGLTPIKKGGGFQTLSLRLKGQDGNFWKFRSMEKDPSKTLPPILRETIAADILNDQISSSHPFAALAAAPILDSLKIIHNKPYLFYMPDSELLGEFREDFGGIVGMMEIHPDVEEDEGISFRGADKIEGTLDLFDRLADKRSEKINAEEYLKARLADLLIGDWDRHSDQWKWALYKSEIEKIWFPIPRDRDQPFAKFDGLLVRVAEYMVPQFVHFGENYPQVEDLTWSGRFVDRRFLTEIDKPTWDSVAQFVQNKVTDQVIDLAISKLPKGVYELSKDELEYKLRKRRNNLLEVSEEYYQLINEVVDIYGSDKKDYVVVNRLNDKSTEVKIYNRDKKNDSFKGTIKYHKIFNNELTNEIRIYLLDDDDIVYLSGDVDCSPLVRIIGGGGADEVIDNSIVNGYWLSITPISNAENKTKVYDSGKKTKVKFGAGTCFNDEEIIEPENQIEKYEPELRDRSHDWFPVPVINLNADDGFILGGGPSITKYNFRADPFDYYMELTAHYATNVKNGAVNFEGVFNSWLPNSAVYIAAEYTGLKYTKYFGFGNETSYDQALEEDNFYRIKNSYFDLTAKLLFGIKSKHKFTLGASFNYSNLSIDNIELLDNAKQNLYGLGKLSSLELNTNYIFDTRDNLDNAKDGFYFKSTFTFTPSIFNIKSNVYSASFEARNYLSLKTFTHITLALRVGGKKVWGDYPFFNAAFVGGQNNLRGYSRERFAGDASLFGQSELRIRLSEVMLILPGYIGLTGFAEAGRVFTEEGNSDKWHPSYGGGVWLDYLERMVTLSANIAFSNEKTALYFSIGMMF
ncbi:MAG: BamA/TamA family outer membrane protein [Ignavibacteriae bacterium]|nr:hypothetical protein [Ignavibacteriota bacterium]NOG97205.1 BamA/TamA family outer membrane protein [Ignavibacteriota bacterium]